METTRLNKFLAHCGIASRRACADLIKAGQVKVDGEVVYDIGYRLNPKQVVTYKGKVVKPEVKKVYILLNKPKNCLTTVKDERGRKTVMDLIPDRIESRIYPVGRLDRDTTGLLLMTNDGDLAKKLSHPSHRVKKIYYITLDRLLSKRDMAQIKEGVNLDDGVAEVDWIEPTDSKNPAEIGLEIHSGKNRVIRRIFEHLGYEVKKLDRVYYAGLTKKDLTRGRWRHLTHQEVIMLKHFT
ncbi:MAG TPA: pseudouridine synthase [Saprospiraceae bacterium]|nr:pseudouridine synthase [Saprospiraceae bacterium]